MNMAYVENYVRQHLHNYEISYRYFSKNDCFDGLERIEIKNEFKEATIDLWSSGWLSLDIFDWILDEQVFLVLLEPSEISKKENALKEFIKILNN